MSNKINLNLTYMEKLPTPLELAQELPLESKEKSYIAQWRRNMTQILDSSDPRLLLIVGPCSIHDVAVAKEYALKLRELANRVSDSFLVLMRVYFEKPRTTTGWKGLLYDPHLDGSHIIPEGLRLTRKLLLELAKMGIPTAAEFLDPISCYYFSDLISWACIGARTSESQIHRQMASALPMPVAFKNSTTGNIEVAVNGVLTAQVPHAFFGINECGQATWVNSLGNPYCHIVLRGGENKPNYDPESIAKALCLLEQHQLPSRIIVDCSHDNSNRKHEEQLTVFKSIMHQFLEGGRSIRGMILESHLHAGNQPLPKDLNHMKYAVSLTDPCLDWKTTESLILWAHDKIAKERGSIIPSALCRN